MRFGPGRSGIAFLLVIFAAGCGGGDAPKASPALDQLRQVAIMCGRYAGTKQGQMPASLEELKTFARSQPALSKDTPIDQLFISPRDQQPYVLVPLGKLGVPGMGEKKIMVHEKTGVNGKRLVAYTTVEIEELDEAVFNAALPGKK